MAIDSIMLCFCEDPSMAPALLLEAIGKVPETDGKKEQGGDPYASHYN